MAPIVTQIDPSVVDQFPGSHPTKYIYSSGWKEFVNVTTYNGKEIDFVELDRTLEAIAGQTIYLTYCLGRAPACPSPRARMIVSVDEPEFYNPSKITEVEDLAADPTYIRFYVGPDNLRIGSYRPLPGFLDGCVLKLSNAIFLRNGSLYGHEPKVRLALRTSNDAFRAISTKNHTRNRVPIEINRRWYWWDRSLESMLFPLTAQELSDLSLT